MRTLLAPYGLVTCVISSLACGGGGQQGTGGSSSSSSAGGGGAGGADPAPIDAPGISKSASTTTETEPFVAATSDGRVAVSWTGTPSTGEGHIGYSVSSDGGMTWTPPASTQQPTGILSA